MRVALISIAGRSRDAAPASHATLAGKTLAQRQLAFALAAGCERIIALGDGGAPDAIALLHAAETAGTRFQVIADGHGLLGAVRATDELLVLAPDLVPEDTAGLDALDKGQGVLVFPAGPGVAAGFERIDLERAWAGALVVPGNLVERLSDLPPDSEPAAALLRIALQARLPERRLSDKVLAHGSWAMVEEGEELAFRERDWLKRNLPPADRFAVSHRLAELGLAWSGVRLLAIPRALPSLWAGVAVLLGGGVAASVYGLAAVGFVLVALGSLLADFTAGLGQLREAPFGTNRRGLARLAPWLVDAALAACVVFAIDGSGLHRLFPPLALLAALHASRPASWPSAGALLADRALLALLFAGAALFGFAEPAVMLAARAELGLDAAHSRGQRG